MNIFRKICFGNSAHLIFGLHSDFQVRIDWKHDFNGFGKSGKLVKDWGFSDSQASPDYQGVSVQSLFMLLFVTKIGFKNNYQGFRVFNFL